MKLGFHMGNKQQKTQNKNVKTVVSSTGRKEARSDAKLANFTVKKKNWTVKSSVDTSTVLMKKSRWSDDRYLSISQITQLSAKIQKPNPKFTDQP